LSGVGAVVLVTLMLGKDLGVVAEPRLRTEDRSHPISGFRAAAYSLGVRVAAVA
jgi:hypothetical protein